MKNQNLRRFLLFIAVLLFILVSRFEPQIRAALTASNPAPYPHKLTQAADMKLLVKDFEEKVARDPEGALDRTALASLYAGIAKRTGDETYYDKAFELANQSLKLLPFDNQGAKSVLAKVAMARHEFSTAISLGKEINQGKHKPDALSILTTSYLAIGDLDAASNSSYELATLRPGLSSYSLRALTLTAMGRDEEAEYYFKKAVQLEDNGETDESAWVRCMWGRFYLRKNNLSMAEGLLKEARRIATDSALATSLLGEVEMKRGSYDQASKLFFEAFTLSRQLPYYRSFAKAKLASGDKKAVDDVLAQVETTLRKEIETGRYGHRVELANVLIDKGAEKDAQEAIGLLEEESKTRHNLDTLKAKLRARLSLKEYEKARDTGEEILKSGVKDKEVYSMLAQIDTLLSLPERAALYEALSK